MSREQSVFIISSVCVSRATRNIQRVYVLTIFISENASKLRLVAKAKYGRIRWECM